MLKDAERIVILCMMILTFGLLSYINSINRYMKIIRQFDKWQLKYRQKDDVNDLYFLNKYMCGTKSCLFLQCDKLYIQECADYDNKHDCVKNCGTSCIDYKQDQRMTKLPIFAMQYLKEHYNRYVCMSHHLHFREDYLVYKYIVIIFIVIIIIILSTVLRNLNKIQKQVVKKIIMN